MKYFMVHYMMPVAGLEAWLAKPEAERKTQEAELKADWDTWLAAHKDMVKNSVGVGKTKRVSASGVEDIKNGIMLSSYVEAESHEAAAAIFKDHPHLKIPEATIEVMETSELK